MSIDSIFLQIGVFSIVGLIAVLAENFFVRLGAIILIIIMLQIVFYYHSLKLRHNKPKTYAEDIIKNNYSNKENLIIQPEYEKDEYRQLFYRPITPRINKPVSRDPEVEAKYLEVRGMFMNKVKRKQIDREDILAIREFLSTYVYEYEKQKWENDCHYIYSMLKAKDLTLAHLYEIEDFLNIVSKKY